MFPGPTNLRLIGCSIEFNLDPKIQIKYIDTKNQLADMLTKGYFTRGEWNHFLCLFNFSHFSSTDCSKVVSKRTQKESSAERVTAKTRPMMSLIAKAPSTLSSSASESPGKRSYESQSPLSVQVEKYHRTEKPVVGPQGGARAQQIINGDDETELDLSLGSRSFLDGVNDQVQKSQKRSSMNVTEDGEKHSVIRRMFMSPTLQASVFMGKNYSDIWHSIKNTKDLIMKQMFDISAKLVSEQDEIYGAKTSDWEHSPRKYLSLIVMNKSSVFSAQRSTSLQILYCVLVRYARTLQSNTAWEQRLECFKTTRNTELWTRLTESRWNSSGIFSQDSPHCSSSTKSKSS